jgi:BNR repeat-like domain
MGMLDFAVRSESLIGWACLLALAWLSTAVAPAGAEDPPSAHRLRILDATPSDEQSPLHTAYYTRPSGQEMISGSPPLAESEPVVGAPAPCRLSRDGGRTWTPLTQTSDFATKLPRGFRREPFPGVLDSKTGRIVCVANALDTKDLDPKIVEPPIALKSYYLRYQVSTDAGRTWLLDEPIVQTGHTVANPLDGVWVGKNGVFLGDIGCAPIFTRRGELLVPAQVCPLGEDGKLANPGGGFTYTDVLVLIGRWGDDHRLNWEVSQRVVGDPKRSTRGMIEPTLAELPDGRIMMVMRGSNDRKTELPSHKWLSVSDDGGRRWTKPQPWTYASGAPFFSPSSMSQLLPHSSGRIYWIGNLTPDNCQGNRPRWPLVIGEVDAKSLGLIESSVLTIDTRRPDDPKQIDISHFRGIEDRQTGEIVVSVPRAKDGYKSTTWTTYRIAK